MEQRKKNKSNHVRWMAVKVAIALLAGWFIYKRVFEKEHIFTLVEEYRNVFSDSSKILLLLGIFILMIVNWSVEAVKWKLMVSKIENVTFLKSLRAVFSGLTISFFTPNRIGEYAGRMFYLELPNRIKGVLITVVENFSQLVVTIVAGSVGFIFYLEYFTSLNGYLFTAACVFLLLFIFSCLLLFLNISVLEIFLGKIRWTKSWREYIEVFGYYSPRDLTMILLLAFIRYAVFTTQFYFLLILFDVEVSYPVAILLISMIFYVMSLVPTIALTEIGVRGAVAIFFLGRVSVESAGILNSTVSLWLINLVVPSLLGIVFIFMFNPGKQKEQ